ncbi:MAG: copper amine oxidase N-terminal domain-containing protein [Peptococcaceae bacterium]|nr:copper amine oxidase N-terminal domain-containing protein [Peptococcaceae bacterium]
MDTAPQIVPRGRTELPARFVAQAFGYQVAWNAAARTVTISDPPPAGPIGTVLFQPIIKNLTVTVGSTTATGTGLQLQLRQRQHPQCDREPASIRG